MGMSTSVDRRPQAGSELMVRVVGELAVYCNGGVLFAPEVGSRKARTLLGYLAVHPGLVPAGRLAAVVWVDTPPQIPAANIATLVSRLRAVLGTSAITGGPAGYRLGEHVRVDLHVARTFLAEAERHAGQPELVLGPAWRAIELLAPATVLAGQPDSPWVEQVRTQHSQLLRRARHATADAALQVGDIRTARTIAEAAVNADAFDETACRILMRADYAAGEPARALITYQRLRATLATELGVDPTLATRELHTAILQGAAT